MRIGFFTDTYWPKIDGVVISIDLLRKEIEKLGHEVFVICPEYPEPTKDDPNVIRVKGFDPLKMSKGFNSNVARGDLKDVRRIEKLDLDILHSHTQFNGGLMAYRISRRKNLPHVSTYHTHLNELISYFPRSFQTAGLFVAPMFAYYMRQLKPFKEFMKTATSTQSAMSKRLDGFKRLFFDETDAVIVNSIHMYRHLEFLELSAPITLIRNGIDTSLFTKTPWEYDGGKLELVFVARLSVEKRQDTVIEAAAELHRRGIDIHLNIAGEGSHEQYCKILVKELGLSKIVTFHGRLTQIQVRELLAKSHIGVFASYDFDTYPLSMLEYLAAGLPVVFCDKNFDDMGTKSSLKRCKPDSYSFADAISEFTDPKLHKKMSKSALKDSKKHDISIGAKKTIALYQDVLGNFKPGQSGRSRRFSRSRKPSKDQA